MVATAFLKSPTKASFYDNGSQPFSKDYLTVIIFTGKTMDSSEFAFVLVYYKNGSSINERQTFQK